MHIDIYIDDDDALLCIDDDVYGHKADDMRGCSCC